VTVAQVAQGGLKCLPIPDTLHLFLRNLMTLTKAQFDQLVENYVSHIIDGLDSETMETMVFDLLTREYEDLSEEDILNEIHELYGEEVVQDLLESATNVTV